MKNVLTLLLGILVLVSCGMTKNSKVQASGPIEIKKVSTDATYGSEKNPIMVGGVADEQGPQNERAFLDQLAGPEGQKISYTRTGSCCAFDSERGFLGQGLLDIYEITYEGLNQPILLYINMYDYQPLYAPVGFTIR